MKKTILIIIFVLFIIIAVAAFLRFVIGGPEDDWICESGQWVKHGNPSASKPTTGCGTTTTNVNQNTNTAKIDEQETCEAQDGRWGSIGLFPAEVCNLPTTDGGQECSDATDCQANLCLTELTIEEMEQFTNGKTIKKTGQCPSWQITIGCVDTVEDGQVLGTTCFD